MEENGGFEPCLTFLFSFNYLHEHIDLVSDVVSPLKPKEQFANVQIVVEINLLLEARPPGLERIASGFAYHPNYAEGHIRGFLVPNPVEESWLLQAQ
jgi:hypothetical protein